VAKQELQLLALSIQKQGWVQPVLITKDGTIIDGFHRSQVAKQMGWEVPCAVLALTEPERMLLTVRINRAKGTHVAFKMADMVKALVKEHGVSIETLCKEIGASREEINLLMLEDVFEKFDVKNHTYNQAQIPGKSAARSS